MLGIIYDSKRKALLELLLEQSLRSSAAMVFVIALIGWVIWFTPLQALVLPWAISGIAILLLRFLYFRALPRLVSPQRFHPSLEISLAVLLFLTGSYWGISGWLLLDIEDLTTFVFVSLAIVAIAPTGLSTLSVLPYMWLLYSAPLLLVLAAKMLQLDMWPLAVLCVLNLAGMWPISKNLGKNVEKLVTLDHRNRELLEQVREEKERAEHANLAKSQFLAAASHDLRQPLHAQGILLEALQFRLQGSEHADLLSKTMQSNESLNALFNSLLEISQLEAGTLKVNPEHLRVREIAQLVIDEHHVYAERLGLDLELEGADCIAITDPILLKRILRNLVSNALKFTERGGVRIRIACDAEQVRISVIDSGPGIPPAEQEKIFEEYYQANILARDRSKGMGLGLALVRRMAHLLDHRISLQSAVGQGATFILSMSCGEASKLIMPPDDVMNEQVEHLKILLIDDESPILDAMCTMLRDWDCMPRGFTRLSSALDSIHREGYLPDLIISDYRLKEDLTGLQAIDALHAELGANVPALIISGDTDPDLLETIHRHNFYLLHKPVKAAQLKKVIRVLMSDHNNRDAVVL